LIFSALNIFNIVAEYFFWLEFGVRYNFIAVDYLVYTTEVINNIKESYPINKIIFAVIIIACVFLLLFKKNLVSEYQYKTTLVKRILTALLILSIPISAFIFIDNAIPNVSENVYENNLAANGLYCLFSAFRHNSLNYYDFYYTAQDIDVFSDIKNLLISKNAKAFKSDYPDYSITRKIENSGAEKKYNVVLVIIESMSADFMCAFGNQENLTPNLDALAKQGLLYTNLYATGTRTVRGLEAITLSIPPLPGQSIIKRPKNENLDFCISKVISTKGYELKFIYGGFGYFDNMNYFFENNGFKTIDRADMNSNEITFSNAWGVCDEDLFNKSINEANISAAQNKPFFFIILTTSNHRPYTYPKNKIDIKSGTGRNGAVKYCDYAIGEFINSAKKQKWFDNTIFVFTADHCASSAGKAKLEIDKYHIPMIIYAPKIIRPALIQNIASQIDIAPTIFELLNWSYTSNFFGNAIIAQTDKNNINNIARVFISNYQKLGYIENNEVVILEPKRKIFSYKYFNNALLESEIKEEIITNAVVYYQTASYIYNKSKQKKISAEQIARTQNNSFAGNYNISDARKK